MIFFYLYSSQISLECLIFYDIESIFKRKKKFAITLSCYFKFYNYKVTKRKAETENRNKKDWKARQKHKIKFQKGNEYSHEETEKNLHFTSINIFIGSSATIVKVKTWQILQNFVECLLLKFVSLA